jgi:hypothetical protein
MVPEISEGDEADEAGQLTCFEQNTIHVSCLASLAIPLFHESLLDA